MNVIEWLWQRIARWILPPAWCRAIGMTAEVERDDGWRNVAGAIAISSAPTVAPPYEPTYTTRLDPDVQSTPTRAFDQLYPVDRKMPTMEQITDRYGY